MEKKKTRPTTSSGFDSRRLSVETDEIENLQSVGSDLMAFGETRVPWGSAVWEVQCETASHRILTFPRTAFGVVAGSGPPIPMHPGHVVMARPNSEYRRVRMDPRGEVTQWLWMSPKLGREIFGIAYDHWGEGRWIAPLDGQTQWRLTLFSRRAAGLASRDSAVWEDELLSVLRRASGCLGRESVSLPRGGETARRAAFEAVDAMLLDLGNPISLAQIAELVGVTTSHLCVLFKEATGQTVARTLLRLRLCESVDRLREGNRDLSRLAHSLCFSSHSHFTARFRQEFGVTPSEARDLLVGRSLFPTQEPG